MVTALVRMLGPVVADERWSKSVALVELPKVSLCRKPLPSGHMLQPSRSWGGIGEAESQWGFSAHQDVPQRERRGEGRGGKGGRKARLRRGDRHWKAKNTLPFVQCFASDSLQEGG